MGQRGINICFHFLKLLPIAFAFSFYIYLLAFAYTENRHIPEASIKIHAVFLFIQQRLLVEIHSCHAIPKEFGGHPSGLVLNETQKSLKQQIISISIRYYYYYYYYYYRYQILFRVTPFSVKNFNSLSKTISKFLYCYISPIRFMIT